MGRYRRFARSMNKDLVEHMIPVNADVGEIDVIMQPEEDALVNPLGNKGVG
jgi:xanthine dehydrogenase YagR molybdenum-binding subunit